MAEVRGSPVEGVIQGNVHRGGGYPFLSIFNMSRLEREREREKVRHTVPRMTCVIFIQWSSTTFAR